MDADDILDAPEFREANEQFNKRLVHWRDWLDRDDDPHEQIVESFLQGVLNSGLDGSAGDLPRNDLRLAVKAILQAISSVAMSLYSLEEICSKENERECARMKSAWTALFDIEDAANSCCRKVLAEHYSAKWPDRPPIPSATRDSETNDADELRHWISIELDEAKLRKVIVTDDLLLDLSALFSPRVEEFRPQLARDCSLVILGDGREIKLRGNLRKVVRFLRESKEKHGPKPRTANEIFFGIGALRSAVVYEAFRFRGKNRKYVDHPIVGSLVRVVIEGRNKSYFLADYDELGDKLSGPKLSD